MIPTGLAPGPSRDARFARAPHAAPTCRCAARDVAGYRDEDGDWTCCRCGHPVESSIANLRSLVAAASGPLVPARAA